MEKVYFTPSTIGSGLLNPSTMKRSILPLNFSKPVKLPPRRFSDCGFATAPSVLLQYPQGSFHGPQHQPNDPTVVSSCPLASNLILFSPFSKRLSTTAPQSCSTMTALRSAAIVEFLHWPPASLVPLG
jgi:hypothetical protein